MLRIEKVRAAFRGQNLNAMSDFDGYIQARLAAASARLRVDVPLAEAQKPTLRAALRKALGGFEDTSSPLEVQIGPTSEVEGGFRSPICFRTRPGLTATGFLLEPVGRAPRAQIVGLPGHGVGVAAIVGLADEPYQANFALQCVRRGYRVLAIEPAGFGTRVSSRLGPHGWSCEADAKSALMLGETLLGWRVGEAMRAVDVLLSFPDARPDRIAMMGISGGGTVSLWTAALDERVAATVVSGAFCPFEESILAIDHCLDNFVPGVLNLVDMPDLAGLIAPRRCFVESGTHDTIFPVSGFRKAVARAAAHFGAQSASSNFGHEVFEGEHRFHGVGAFAFLDEAFPN